MLTENRATTVIVQVVYGLWSALHHERTYRGFKKPPHEVVNFYRPLYIAIPLQNHITRGI